LVAPLDLRPSSLAQIAWWGHHFFLGALLPQTWVLFLCCSFFSPFADCVFHLNEVCQGFIIFKSSFFLPSLGCLVISPRVCCHSSLTIVLKDPSFSHHSSTIVEHKYHLVSSKWTTWLLRGEARDQRELNFLKLLRNFVY
jgi:hypothetical protein